MTLRDLEWHCMVGRGISSLKGDTWRVLILQVVDLKGNEGVEFYGLAHKGRQ